MKKKWLSVICSISMIVLLVACGQEKQETQTENQENTVTDDSSQGGTVDLTVWGAEEDQALLQKMVDSFTKQYGSEANFNIIVAPESESTCKETLLADIENGADVFAFADDQLRSMVAGGALQKVSNPDEIASQNLEGAVEAASVNDVLYAYPMTADNGYFMYYNDEYFSAEDVTSLDKMLEIAAEQDKKVAMDWSSGWYLYSFFGATGMEMGMNDDGVTNYCTWNATDGAVKGVDVVEAMLNIAANPGFINLADSEFVEGMKDGSVIAGVNGTWNASNAQEAWGSHYAATKLPTYDCAGQEVQLASFAGYKLIGVNAYSKHIDWAEKLAEWITNEDNQNLRFAERSQGPANKNAAASADVGAAPAIQALLAQSEYSSLQRVGGNYWDPMQTYGQTLLDGNPNDSTLQDIVDTLVNGITASVAK